MKLSDYEIDILRTANGEERGLSWGAAMGAAMEFLGYDGLMTRTGKITQKGRDFLKELNNA